MELQTVPRPNFKTTPVQLDLSTTETNFDLQFLTDIQGYVIPEYSNYYLNIFPLFQFMREKRIEIEQAPLSDLPPSTATHFFHATDPRIQQPISKVLSLLHKNIIRAHSFIQTKEFALFDQIKEFFIKIQALKYRLSKDPQFSQMSYWMLFTFDEYISQTTNLLNQLFKIFKR